MRINKIKPGIRIVITVSPVPLSQTFSGKDVAVANMYSKCVLRTAAEVVANACSTFDYFPSYEMVSLSPRTSAYAQDCIHVSDSIVGEVVRSFLELYAGFEPQDVAFNELGYLAANQDVEAALRRGEFESGFEHWTLYGQKEGRRLRPESPTSFMVAAGAVRRPGA